MITNPLEETFEVIPVDEQPLVEQTDTPVIVDTYDEKDTNIDDEFDSVYKKVEAATPKPTKAKPEGKGEVFDIEKGFGEEIAGALEHAEERGSIQISRKKRITRKRFMFKDPEIEKRVQAAKGVKTPSLTTKTVALIRSLKNKATREYEHLHKNKEYADASFALRKLAKQKGVASDRTLRAIQGITIKLGKEDYNLFGRNGYNILPFFS